VDTRWDGKKEAERVEFLSEAWRALLGKDRRLAEILALGDRIRLVWEGRAYEVLP
jgi:hypothetical protein